MAASADNSVTLWDLSVELDEEERPFTQGDRMRDVPAQLLFVHHEKDPKEVHFHAQTGLAFATGADGFSAFKTISLS